MTVSNIRLSSLSKAFTRLADWAALAFAAPHDPLYRMEQDGYQAALEHEVESRFAISNGFLGVRASLEQPTIASRPRTFIAGLFDASTTYEAEMATVLDATLSTDEQQHLHNLVTHLFAATNDGEPS